jgi:hypothetical protein
LVVSLAEGTTIEFRVLVPGFKESAAVAAGLLPADPD